VYLSKNCKLFDILLRIQIIQKNHSGLKFLRSAITFYTVYALELHHSHQIFYDIIIFNLSSNELNYKSYYTLRNPDIRFIYLVCILNHSRVILRYATFRIPFNSPLELKK